jgi:hypothetical protein
MRKTLTLALLCCASILFAQSRSHVGHMKQRSLPPDSADNLNVNLAWYASASLSVSSGDGFSDIAYPSIEVGVSKNNISYGLNVGRRDLANHGEREYPSNYYIEGKAAATWPLGDVKTFAMGGFGVVPDTDHYLIEYGTGLIWSTDWVDLIMQISNWDRTDYLSIGVSRNL